MNKITTEFQDGQILHAADLNPLITSINQAADELATKANSATLANTTRTANNALASATIASNTASRAETNASAAHTAAQTANANAAQAMETATDAQTEALRRLLMIEFDEVVEGVTVNQATISSVDAVCYNKTTMTFVARNGLRYYNNWPNAGNYGSTQKGSGWEPKEGVIYYNSGNIFIYDGGPVASFWRLQMELFS